MILLLWDCINPLKWLFQSSVTSRLIWFERRSGIAWSRVRTTLNAVVPEVVDFFSTQQDIDLNQLTFKNPVINKPMAQIWLESVFQGQMIHFV